MSERNTRFTDEELQGIADRLYDNFKRDLFLNAGKGFVGFIGKALIAVGIAFAGYYMGTSK